MDLILVAGVSLVSCILTLIFLAARYRRCPSNQILAVYGKVAKGQSVKCYHGGGTFVWPLIQDYAYLDLTPITIHINLKSALSLHNIRVNLPSTFTIAIGTTEELMSNAAIRLLDLNKREIELMASEIIFGQLRLTVASLTIEQINLDRESFLESIRDHIDTELKKIGLILINVNITDIHDESGYIDSIGKKAASAALNQAKIDVAEAEKRGEIGKALAEKERRISVAAYHAQAIEGENLAKAHVATYNADLAEKQALADQRSEVAEQQAAATIQEAKAIAELKRLETEQIVVREIEKRKIEIDAQAAAEKQKTEAAGHAESILLIKTAEAEGTQRVLSAKAHGYQELIKSCGNNSKDAATMLLVEKLEELVKLQTEAIRNIKIDKITVWDSGNAKDGSSTANFMKNMVKSLPSLHDVANMAGMELPEYLGKLTEDKKIHIDSSETSYNKENK
ncbi:MAG TPA: SPFH domain-containing protein [Candidatus Babeliales bacterium]|nr:SPFH domain-containing protein [Candidatus Babeliales bacterium]